MTNNEQQSLYIYTRNGYEQAGKNEIVKSKTKASDKQNKKILLGGET